MKTILEITRLVSLRAIRIIPARKPHRAAMVATMILLGGTLTSADVVTEWNAIMETTVAGVDPAAQVRSAAIAQLAVFDAVNAIICDHAPYLGSINAPLGASPEAAAIAAAHRALVVLHPDKAAILDAARVTSLGPIPDSPGKIAGLTLGVATADALLARRATDGFNTVAPYTPGTRPGEWQPTPPDFTPAFRPGLGRVVPFKIAHGAKFRSPPPPALHSARYAQHYEDVKAVGALNSPERPPDRAEVARFYEVTDAVPIYFPAARQVSAAQGKSLSENAGIFALRGMAIFDAAVACFETKYHYNYWRPVTAIRAGDTDGNRRTDPDPAWQPLIFTPPFPSYPSGHASLGAAARIGLEHVFGEDGHNIVLSNPQAPGIILRSTSFEQITDDIDDARVFGGVHYRFDQEAGARQGKRVGAYILRHALHPVRRSGGEGRQP